MNRSITIVLQQRQDLLKVFRVVEDCARVSGLLRADRPNQSNFPEAMIVFRNGNPRSENIQDIQYALPLAPEEFITLSYDSGERDRDRLHLSFVCVEVNTLGEIKGAVFTVPDDDDEDPAVIDAPSSRKQYRFLKLLHDRLKARETKVFYDYEDGEEGTPWYRFSDDGKEILCPEFED